MHLAQHSRVRQRLRVVASGSEVYPVRARPLLLIRLGLAPEFGTYTLTTNSRSNSAVTTRPSWSCSSCPIPRCVDSGGCLQRSGGDEGWKLRVRRMSKVRY